MSCARAGAQCRARPRLEALRAARRRRRSLRDADLLLQLPLPLQQHPLHADLRPGWVPQTQTLSVLVPPRRHRRPRPPARPPSPRTPTLLGPIRPSCTLRSPLLFCCEAGGATGAIAGWRAKQQSFQQARKDYTIKKCVPPQRRGALRARGAALCRSAASLRPSRLYEAASRQGLGRTALRCEGDLGLGALRRSTASDSSVRPVRPRSLRPLFCLCAVETRPSFFRALAPSSRPGWS